MHFRLSIWSKLSNICSLSTTVFPLLKLSLNDVINVIYSCVVQEPAIKGKSWRSLDLSHNPIITSTNCNNQSQIISQFIVYQNRNDFKNNRSSSEPVTEQSILPNYKLMTIASSSNHSHSHNNTIDDAQFDCLQNIPTIKVRIIEKS